MLHGNNHQGIEGNKMNSCIVLMLMGLGSIFLVLFAVFVSFRFKPEKRYGE
jgi:hypothetical protein